MYACSRISVLKADHHTEIAIGAATYLLLRGSSLIMIPERKESTTYGISHHIIGIAQANSYSRLKTADAFAVGHNIVRLIS